MERRRRDSTGLMAVITKAAVPTLDAYITISSAVAILSSLTVATTFQSHPELKTLLAEELRNNTGLTSELNINVEYVSSLTFVQFIHFFLSDANRVYVFVNTYFAMLALLSKFIINVAFKELSKEEESIARTAFISTVFGNIVMLSIVTEPENSYYYKLAWMLWLGLSIFLSTINFLIYQRFKYISLTVGKKGRSLFVLSLCALGLATAMSYGVLKYRMFFSWCTSTILAIDCLLGLLRSSHALIVCLISSAPFYSKADQIRHATYWLDFSVNLACEVLQLLNFLDLAVISKGRSPISCIVVYILVNMRHVYKNILGLISQHQRHKKIFEHIEHTYPLVKSADPTDKCAVCWEVLGESRRLPCAHQYHEWCLMWWMAQHASCPTCRREITSPLPAHPDDGTENRREFGTNFTGGFSFLQLPAFLSTELSVPSMLSPLFGPRTVHLEEEQLNSMTEQVREMFPQMPTNVIVQDLLSTGSAQATIENILEGRIPWNLQQLGDETFDESEAESEQEEEAEWRPESVYNYYRENNGDGESTSRTEDGAEGEPDIEVEDAPEETHFEKQRRLMIAKYRKKYLESDRAEDLRAKGIKA